MSLDTEQLKLRVEAKIDALKSQLKSYAADKKAESNVQKAETESKLREVETHIKNGWDKMTAEASAKLNEWLK
jgi:hypothetical protein